MRVDATAAFGLEVKENIKRKKIYMLHVLGVLLPYIFWCTLLLYSSCQRSTVLPFHYSVPCSLTVIVCHQTWPIERPHQSADTATDGSTELCLFSLYSRTIRWIFLLVQADLHVVCSSVHFLFVTFILTKRRAKTHSSAIIPPPFPSFSPPVSPRLRSSPCANCPGVHCQSFSFLTALAYVLCISTLTMFIAVI